MMFDLQSQDGLPGTLHVDQTGLKLTEICLSSTKVKIYHKPTDFKNEVLGDWGNDSVVNSFVSFCIGPSSVPNMHTAAYNDLYF